MLPDDGRLPEVRGPGWTGPPAPAQTTGRWKVGFADQADPIATLRSAGLADVVNSLDFADQAVDVAQAEAADAIVFAQLGVAVVTGDLARVGAVRSAVDGGVLAVEPEYVHQVLGRSGGHEYVTGYRDGVSDLGARLLAGISPRAGVAEEVTPAFQDNAQFTWGLQATGVASAPHSGKGTKVAVLDTGFTFDHPDFVGRDLTSSSFVSGVATAEDGHGHGTHCVGTSCGPKDPPSGVRRYGCAYQAQVFVGKVLDDQGAGVDTRVLAGINWAVANRTEVISMSLGAPVAQVSQVYETVGRRALDNGCLIVAAAGNNAHRDQPSLPPQQRFGFVGIPANSPSVLAVAAVDEQLDIAVFSARSLTGVPGGSVDIGAPGVRVFSSWNRPRPEQGNQKYRSISGTSMATPHVSGIAALWSQSTGRSGRALWTTLTQRAQRLGLPAVDVGSGRPRPTRVPGPVAAFGDEPRPDVVRRAHRPHRRDSAPSLRPGADLRRLRDRPADEPLPATLLDLSEGGLRCTVRKPVQIERYVPVVARLSFLPQPAEAPGQVIRVVEQPEVLDVGITFDDPAALGDEIRKFVFAVQLQQRAAARRA